MSSGRSSGLKAWPTCALAWALRPSLGALGLNKKLTPWFLGHTTPTSVCVCVCVSVIPVWRSVSDGCALQGSSVRCVVTVLELRRRGQWLPCECAAPRWFECVRVCLSCLASLPGELPLGGGLGRLCVCHRAWASFYTPPPPPPLPPPPPTPPHTHTKPPPLPHHLPSPSTPPPPPQPNKKRPPPPSLFFIYTPAKGGWGGGGGGL